MRATDADFGQNAAIVYEIAAATGTASFDFQINNLTGVITSTVAVCFADYAILTIRASDQGTPSLSVNVTVRIQTVNVNLASPMFTFPGGATAYSTSVLESIGIGTNIINVSALDTDCGDTPRITYTMQQGFGIFVIDAALGHITTMATLDFETQTSYVHTSPFVTCLQGISSRLSLSLNLFHSYTRPPSHTHAHTHTHRLSLCVRYTLVVSATDNFPGSPRIDVAFFTVNVLDANDEAPVFTQTSYAATILEGNTTNRSVIAVFAADRDSGLGGIVRYTLDVTDGSSFFAIDSVSPRPQMYEYIGTARFHLNRTDGMHPPTHTSCSHSHIPGYWCPQDGHADMLP